MFGTSAPAKPAARRFSSRRPAAAATPVAETASDATPTTKRRPMTAKETKAVSERMSTYWAERRKNAAKWPAAWPRRVRAAAGQRWLPDKPRVRAGGVPEVVGSQQIAGYSTQGNTGSGSRRVRERPRLARGRPRPEHWILHEVQLVPAGRLGGHVSVWQGPANRTDISRPSRGETPRSSRRHVLRHRSRRRTATIRSGIATSPAHSPSACGYVVRSEDARAAADRPTSAVCRRSVRDRPGQSTAGPCGIARSRRSGNHATYSFSGSARAEISLKGQGFGAAPEVGSADALGS